MTVRTLDIFEDHPVPLELITQRVVVLGTSGSGKTSGQRSLAEIVWRKHGIRFGVFDLAEDWWGLKSSADGKHEGIPVVVFGGDHADLPIPTSGVEFARLVVKLEQPWIADLKALPKPLRLTFIADAFYELLRINKGNPLVLFCDEADSYAPEDTKSKEAFRSADATEELAKRGRKQGLFPVFITQRNAAITKDVTELCQVGLLYRCPGSIDQKVAVEYLGHSVPKAEIPAILADLESLPDGECYVVSKAPKMKMRARVKVKQPTTFDSSATPGLGHRRREPKVLARPDIEKLRVKLAADLEKAKKEDPAELQREVARLTRELKVANTAAARPAPAPVAAAGKTIVQKILGKREAASLVKAIDRLASTSSTLDSAVNHAGSVRADVQFALEELRTVVKEASALSAGAPTGNKTLLGNAVGAPAVRAGAPVQSGPARSAVTRVSGERSVPKAVIGTAGGPPARAEGLEGLQKADRAILAALSTYGAMDIGKLALLTGYRVSGGFKNALARLRGAELITGDNDEAMDLTDAARSLDLPELPTGDALIQFWREHRSFQRADKAVLDVLIGVYPEGRTIEELAEATGYAISGGFKNALTRLRTAGVLVGRNTDTMYASKILFGEAA